MKAEKSIIGYHYNLRCSRSSKWEREVFRRNEDEHSKSGRKKEWIALGS